MYKKDGNIKINLNKYVNFNYLFLKFHLIYYWKKINQLG